MGKENEFHPGIPPQDSHEEVSGLNQAIEATRMRIWEYKDAGADISDLKFHLKNLERRLKVALKKVKKIKTAV